MCKPWYHLTAFLFWAECDDIFMLAQWTVIGGGAGPYFSGIIYSFHLESLKIFSVTVTLHTVSCDISLSNPHT